MYTVYIYIMWIAALKQTLVVIWVAGRFDQLLLAFLGHLETTRGKSMS